MKSSDNSLVVASFKNMDEEVIKTIFFNGKFNFNIGMIPEDATSYYVYSKKEDGKFSCDSSCRIGKTLRDAIENNKENIRLLAFLAISQKECAYLVKDGKERVALIDDNMSLVSDFEEFAMSFENDVQNVMTSDKKLIKKM